MNHPRPPAHVQPYITALGFELAVKFLLHFGGAELKIPVTPEPQSELVEVLGPEAALALCSYARKTVLPRRVPTAKPWLARYMLIIEGLSQAKIARRLHTSDVSVRRWIAGKDDREFPDLTDQRQMKLI